MSVLRTEKLIKHYSRTEALRGVSRPVERGPIFGLLGPKDAAAASAIYPKITTSQITTPERVCPTAMERFERCP